MSNSEIKVNATVPDILIRTYAAVQALADAAEAERLAGLALFELVGPDGELLAYLKGLLGEAPF